MREEKIPYTLLAKDVLEEAEKEAKALKQTYIGTEHILLGLLDVKCVVSEVLKRNGVTKEGVMDLLSKLIILHDEPTPGRKPKIQFTPKAEILQDIAYDEALRGGMDKVATEHLMIAILCQDDSVAMRVLRSLNVNDEKFAFELFQAMGEDGLIYIEELRNGRNGDPIIGTETIERFSRDLLMLARDGKIDPIIGRDIELDRLITTLSRRTKNNPCLIGEPGVGKTAIVERLALEMEKGNVPETIKNKKLFALDLASMVAGTKYRGEFEERIEKVIKEAAADGNVILFLDEIHTVIGAGGAEGALDAANILKPALSRGEIQIIGATTIDEYRKHIEKDSALERRFQPIIVEEPSVSDAKKILEGLRKTYEAHHKVKISDDAVSAAVDLSTRYISDRYLPDKAIDVMDEAAAKAKLKASGKKTKKEITIGEDEIAEVISNMTKIPVSKLTESEGSRLKKLEKILHKRVIGQDEAVSSVAKAVRRGRVGLKDPKRPVGSFLFLGPTGVGKTELARALSEALFGKEDAMIRVDMSEYMEAHTVSKLIGSPPGYVGFDDGGQLSEKVRRNPYSVILFDEIEKAHPDIFHVLLQILDDGRITDSKGRTVDFKNTIIIMTSNAGAEKIVAPKKLGFSADETAEDNYKKMKDGVMDEVKKLFKPELLNRIDEILVFHALDKEDVKEILKLQVKEFAKRTKESLGIELKVNLSAYEFLMNEGYDPKYGARPLKRAIQSELEDALAIAVLTGEVKEGVEVTASFDKTTNKITFE